MEKLVIGIDMGHSLSGAGTGASGILSEVVINRKIGKALIGYLKASGHTVVDCSVDYASSTNAQLSGIVTKANVQKLDLFVSIHLNAGGGNGTETYTFSGASASTKAKAKAVNDAIVGSCGFTNRGIKEAAFYVLRATNSPAILIEVCFVDSQVDANKLDCDAVAKAMFKALTGTAFTGSQPASNNSGVNTSGSYTVKITADVLNVRKGAGTSYAVTTTVKKGEVYTITETVGNWGKLKSGAGYICLDYVNRL